MEPWHCGIPAWIWQLTWAWQTAWKGTVQRTAEARAVMAVAHYRRWLSVQGTFSEVTAKTMHSCTTADSPWHTACQTTNSRGGTQGRYRGRVTRLTFIESPETHSYV